MKQTTVYDKNTWLPRCRDKDCEEETVKCPSCRHNGHVVTHVMNGDRLNTVEICIQHSHFLENEDAGRNMYCTTKHRYFAKGDEIVLTWKLSSAAKQKIINLYVSKFKGKKKQ